MHILVVNNLYPPIMAGGAELIVRNLAEGLAARGHRVTAVTTCGPEMEPYPVETIGGVEILRFFPKNMYWSFARSDRPRWQKALWHLKDSWNRDAGQRLAEIMADGRPDVMHTHVIDGFSGAIWRRARALGVPVVHTAHDYHLMCPRAFMLDRNWHLCTKPSLQCRVFRHWHLGTTRHLSAFVSPSQFLLDEHVAAGLSVPVTGVVPNGVPLVAVPGAGARDIDPPVHHFLLAARLTQEKGILVAIEAMAALRDVANIRLTIAGRGPLEAQVREAAAKDPRIDFAGFISGEQKDRIFQTATALLIPSLWYENAPVIIVEAAAYGIGVVGSRIGAIPEFIRDGETGLLFEPGDPAGLATALRRIAAEPALRRRFAENAPGVVDRFTIDGMVDGYLQQYRAVGAGA